MIFGPAPYDVYSPTAPTTVGTITYTCPAVLSPVVSLSASSNGAYRPRQMTSGAELLNYELYFDAAMTIVWGTGPDSQSVPTGNMSIPVYGRIFALQDVAIGTYTDSIIVTFNF